MIYYLFTEIISSLWDKSLRIQFAQWGNPQDFFLEPLDMLFKDHFIKYRIVKQYAPHIYLCSVFGNKNKILTSRAGCKIFFTGENVHDSYQRYISYNDLCLESVNLSMGFDFLEAENYLRFPIWIYSFFSPYDSKDDIKNKLMNFGCLLDIKTKFCALVASHDANGIRARIYNDVSRIAPIDCPGNLLHNDETLHSQYGNDKALYLRQYKFNICPENSISPGYVTEKLFQSLYSGCIPIYNGWSKNPEPDIVNPNIILWYDPDGGGVLNEISKLYLNDRLYRSFISQPFFLDTAVDKIYMMLQQFIDKMQYIVKESLQDYLVDN